MQNQFERGLEGTKDGKQVGAALTNRQMIFEIEFVNFVARCRSGILPPPTGDPLQRCARTDLLPSEEILPYDVYILTGIAKVSHCSDCCRGPRFDHPRWHCR